MISKLLTKIVTIVFEAVFPPKCLVCDKFFRPLEPSACRGMSGKSDLEKRDLHLSVRTQAGRLLSAHLCPQCILGLKAVESPLCTICGLPFKSRQGADHLCGDCIASPKKFRFARAPLVYDQVVTEIIHCFKYRGKIKLAGSLSEILLTAFGFFWQKGSIDVIVPVPLHLKRVRERGFNQAYLLIRNWQTTAARSFLDLADLHIERDVLVRTLPTAPQTTLDRSQRAANIKAAFGIRRKDRITDKRVLLIDDVYTTGATVDECARLLLKHGAEHVDVLTLARAV
jgi:ComF family protein